MFAAAICCEPTGSVLPFSREHRDRPAAAGWRAGAHDSQPHYSTSASAHLLLLDDDPAALTEQLRGAFPSSAYRVDVARSGPDGLRHFEANSPDVVVLDLELSEASGLETYQQIRRIDARVPVIFVTGVRRADSAIEAIKQGAYDILFKPLDPRQLRRVVGEALEVARRMRRPAVSATDVAGPDVVGAIVGGCPAMLEVYKAVGRVAGQDVPVLITGESGTGKELVARAVYQHSKRAKSPFLALNCAAIPENLLESELFGHEKGAFTGADRRRIGKFEQCDGGTLFLDEVGDMPPALQAKLLRVLHEQAFERVGGNETIRTDVRLIAATHRDLKAWSDEGRFRPDLYYRLGVFSIHLPPLRERGEDLALLVRYLVRRFAGELGREVQEVAPEALERLYQYSWPGNVRELQSILKQALLRATGPVLLPAFLPDTLAEAGRPDAPPARSPALEAYIHKLLRANTQEVYAQTHRWLDRILIPIVMEHARSNQSQAANVLGIARQTLRQRLLETGLVEPPSRDIAEDETTQPVRA
jgi:two-component system nitrogen regulation response regulator GlnG